MTVRGWSDVATSAAWQAVRDYVAVIMADYQAGYIKDVEDLDDQIHQTADDACTYTVDQWLYAYGLTDADSEDLGGGTFEEKLTAKAYCNMRAAIEGHSEIEELREKLESGEE